jgi:hypothetical protein
MTATAAQKSANYAPFVVEIHRYTDPDRFGFHHFTPVLPGGAVYPFNHATFRSRIELLDEQETVQQSLRLQNQDYVDLPWGGIWPDLKEYIIRQVIPLEWKTGVRDGDESLTSRIVLWTKAE